MRFVGIEIEGEAKEYLFNLTKEISEKFDTEKLHEKIMPHITIFWVGDSEPIKGFDDFIKNWITLNKPLPNFHLNDFNRFGDRVVFTKCQIDEETILKVEKLKAEMTKLLNLPPDEYPEWVPHATLASKLRSEEIINIWEYVQIKPRPNFVIPFNNICIFKKESELPWVIEEKFEI